MNICTRITYLGVPYSHESPVVRQQRFDKVTDAAAHLINLGHIIYSPITHHHPMATRHSMPTGWNFWGRLDLAYLQVCQALFVLPLEGWKQSTGLIDELRVARDLRLDIQFLDPDTYDIDWEFKFDPSILSNG